MTVVLTSLGDQVAYLRHSYLAVFKAIWVCRGQPESHPLSSPTAHISAPGRACNSKLSRVGAGDATIEGLSIREDMGSIYSMLGVCPQHDLLWEQLTPMQHLNFYGRLKNLKVHLQSCPPQRADHLSTPQSLGNQGTGSLGTPRPQKASAAFCWPPCFRRVLTRLGSAPVQVSV